MKFNIKVLFFLTLALNLFVASCKKDSDTTPSEEVLTTEEAVETTEAILASATDDIEEMAAIAGEYSAETDTSAVGYCNMTFDTTWTQSNSNGTASGTYTSTWSWKVICNNIFVPVALEMGVDADGEFETLVVEGNETGAGDYTLDGLLPSESNYTVNGTYGADGDVKSKKGFQNTYTMEANVTFSDVSIDKTTYTITSGMGTVTLIATSPAGNKSTFTGSITFNGDGTATLVINGKSYTITL